MTERSSKHRCRPHGLSSVPAQGLLGFAPAPESGRTMRVAVVGGPVRANCKFVGWCCPNMRQAAKDECCSPLLYLICVWACVDARHASCAVVSQIVIGCQHEVTSATLTAVSAGICWTCSTTPGARQLKQVRRVVRACRCGRVCGASFPVVSTSASGFELLRLHQTVAVCKRHRHRVLAASYGGENSS